MHFPLPRLRPGWLILFALLAPAAGRVLAAPTGPTLQFDYGAGRVEINPLGYFMYFIPLISPEPVYVTTNAGNTQCARVNSCLCHTNGASFHAVCEFDFLGAGLQRSIFDLTPIIRRRSQELQAGKALARQLAAISVQGAGDGSLEIDGTLTNGQAAVVEMRLRFNSRGHSSPVSVELHDVILRDGGIHYENEIVARVNTLTFRQKAGPPKMEVSLASVKRADAGNSHWQNFLGDLKGVAANLLLPPLTITSDGQQAMMDFGLAVAQARPDFTFPFAERLQPGPATAP